MISFSDPQLSRRLSASLLLVAREEELQDIARIDDVIVGLVFRLWVLVLAQGLCPVTNWWSFTKR
jgi:hypothetical protein